MLNLSVPQPHRLWNRSNIISPESPPAVGLQVLTTGPPGKPLCHLCEHAASGYCPEGWACSTTWLCRYLQAGWVTIVFLFWETSVSLIVKRGGQWALFSFGRRCRYWRWIYSSPRVVKLVDSRIRVLGLRTVLRDWASNLTTLSLSFLSVKWGWRGYFFKGCCEDGIRQCMCTT